MPKIYAKEPEKPETSGPDSLQKPDSDKNKPLEFRAEIIPYDTCENSNSPLLAFSGDNINIIFNIPKEIFRKLAVAAIGHLDPDSDCKPPENSASARDSQSGSCIKHSDNSTSNLNVKDFEIDSTNNMNTYEDGYKSDPVKNKGDISQTDPKSHEVADLLSKSEETNANLNGSMELNGESLSNDCETKKPNQSSEMDTVSRQVPEDSIQVLARHEECLEKSISGADESGSDNVKYKSTLEEAGETDYENSNGKSEKNEMKELDENEFSELEHPDPDSKQNPEICATENSDHDESADSLDISNEDCPNLENAWPYLPFFTKTEAISVEKIKSFELNGDLIKFFKLDFLNELIVIKVTNTSVEAAIYKLDSLSERNSSDSNACSCKSKDFEEKQSTESFSSEVSLKSATNVGNMQEDSTDIESISYDQNKDEALACTSKTEEMNSVLEENNPVLQAEFTKVLDFQIESKELDSKSPLTQSKPSNFINETSEVESITESLMDLNAVTKRLANMSSDIIKSILTDEKAEAEIPDKDDKVQEMVSIKIAQKLEELDINFPGSSPTKRLMLSLHDSLENTTVEPEAEEKIAELISNFSGNLSELRDKPKSSDYCESEFQAEEHLNEVDAEARNVTELSDKCCDSSDKRPELPQKPISDNISSAQSDILDEIKPQLKIESTEDFSPSEDVSIQSINVDESSAEKPILNDRSFHDLSLTNVNVSLEETNIDEKCSGKIEFGNVDSKKEVLMNACRQSEYIKENDESDPSEKLANSLYEGKEEIVRKQCKTPDNAICSSEKINIKNESYEVNNEENVSLEETIKSPKLEMSKQPECLEENAIHDENLNTADNSVKKTIEENLIIHKNSCDSELSGNITEETNERNEYIKCEEPDTNLVTGISQASQSSTAEEGPENKCEQKDPFKSKLGKEMNDDNEVENEKISNEYIKCEEPDTNLVAPISQASQSSTAEESPEKKFEQNSPSKSKLPKEMNDDNEMENESISDELIKDETTIENLEATDSVECKSSFKETPSENKSLIEQSSEFIENDSDLDKTSNSCKSNGYSLMDTTVEADAESISEGGDLESDDVKSVASESDDSKDSEKKMTLRKKSSRKESDEVDCAPTRVRTKRAASLLSEDVIPENSEVKNAKTSKARGSTQAAALKTSGRTSPVGRSLRSKSLDPNPQPSKTPYDKKHDNIVESEVNRKTRAKTPDIISKKDIKTTVRSSPRKLARSSAIPEPSSASKIQSTKPSVGDGHSKSRANLDSSLSTSKRTKRGGKD